MKDTIHFVTLFPNCPNYGLVKDVGQIPYVLGKYYENIEAELVSRAIDTDGPNIDKVQGLKIRKIPYLFKNDAITGVYYLLRYSKKIDWLNVYHCGRRSFYWTKLYKLLNPKGKVYLKLDLDFVCCDRYDENLNERCFLKKATQAMDLISIESTATLDRIQKYIDQEVKLISNGYQSLEEEMDLSVPKDNIFITVGRLGTKQKATDILLEAFAKTIDKHNWKLKLIGTIEPEFETIKDKFFNDYPGLRDRVIFLGEIKDRKLLYSEYAKAKVFVLPSRWESFGIAGAEALACGCRIIISEGVAPMKEMTNNRKYGNIIPVDDIDALQNALLNASLYQYSAKEAKEIAEYAQENFSWIKICEKLNVYLKA